MNINVIKRREQLAIEISKRRKELKITQEQLAEQTGLGIATIKRAELGKFWLNTKILFLIFENLDLDMKLIKK